MKEYEELGDGSVIFRGRYYPFLSLRNQEVDFDVEKWLKFWKEKAEEIKKLHLEYFQIKRFHEEFLHHILTYGGTKQMLKRLQEFTQLGTELNIAYQIAYSNYRDSKRGLRGLLIGLFGEKALKNLPIPPILKK